MSAKPKGGARSTTREFTNELGNAIRITIEGPESTSENVLTPMEVSELRSALNDHARPQPALAGGWNVGEPPKDGELYVVIGSILWEKVGVTTYTPILRYARWVSRPGYTGWLDEDELAIAILECERLDFHYWISLPPTGSPGGMNSALPVERPRPGESHAERADHDGEGGEGV